MSSPSFNFINDYINNQNRHTNILYSDLKNEYNNSLKIYKNEVNILGIYFFDILKILTLFYLKNDEILTNTYIKNDLITKKLIRFPYLGYKDILEGIDIKNKKFGKQISTSRNIFKSILNKYSYIKKKFISSSVKRISLISPRLENNLLLSNIDNFHFISIPEKINIPFLNDQINTLKKSLKYLINKNLNRYNYSETLIPLIEEHIKANCHEGYNNFSIDGDYFVYNSGVELQNRFISSFAKFKNIPNFQIAHGESFGVYNEPVWSKYGDSFNADIILGYGKIFKNKKNLQSHNIKQDIDYFSSNAPGVLKHYNKSTNKIKDFKDLNIYYFPTTLSGLSYRYGPFRDTSDFIYLKWQLKLIELFGENLKFKMHPKEKYDFLYTVNQSQLINSTFDNIMSSIDIFVFDYIGTAFNIACSSNKPIIYFDLGIRSINNEALKKIKERVIYFNISEEIPKLYDIKDGIYSKNINHGYVDDYCLGDKINDRVHSFNKLFS